MNIDIPNLAPELQKTVQDIKNSENIKTNNKAVRHALHMYTEHKRMVEYLQKKVKEIKEELDAAYQNNEKYTEYFEIQKELLGLED